MRRFRRFRKRNRINPKLILIVLIVFIGIGYSVVSTNLNINGNTTISTNSSDFVVMFSKVEQNNENITNNSVTNNGKTLTISTSDLINAGDNTSLEYVITNKSSQYDANIDISCTSENHYEIYSINNNLSSNIIESKQSTTGTLQISLTDASTNNDNIICNLTPTAIERTTKGEIQMNSHIKKVYTYNEGNTDKCLGGAEEGCQEIEAPDTYPVGTIIKYEVASGVEKYFNVLYDNGSTLTMQQTENTVNTNTAWNSSASDATTGPTTILTALESATNGWDYVNNQTYTLGETIFGTGTFATNNTGCAAEVGEGNYVNCNFMTYPQMAAKTAKARLITAQEAGQMGCKAGTINSCKLFMSNYLSQSRTYGGTNNSSNGAYWTSSAQSDNNYFALMINYYGRFSSGGVDSIYEGGARAVIEIDKY